MSLDALTSAIEIHRTRLQNDPAYKKEYLRKIRGPPKRELSESEGKEMLVILSFLTPTSVSNNQRTITEEYSYNNKVYNVHYGIYDYPLVEEILED